jgi:chaperonin GroES
MACTPLPLRFRSLQGGVVRSGGIAWARRGLVRSSLRGFSAARSAGRWRAAPPAHESPKPQADRLDSHKNPSACQEHMNRKHKRLIVVGDRVLVKTEDGDQRSKVGLYLPPTAIDNQAVQGGEIVSTGPGLALPELTDQGEEPWRISGGSGREARFVPMQAQVGDFALFFRKAAVEITFENEQYLVVPQAAILALVREPREDIPEY